MEAQKIAEVKVQGRSSYRAQGLPVAELLRMFASGRWAAFEEGWLGMKRARERNETAFVVSQEVETDEAIPKIGRQAIPHGVEATCRLQVIRIGNSSFTLKSVLTFTVQDKPLQATNTVTYVFVNPETRKSSSISPEMRESLEAALVTSGVPFSAPPALVDAFIYSFTVRPSDCDWNSHMNQSQYLTLLTDALEAQAATPPAVLSLSISYKKELCAADIAEIRFATSGNIRPFQVVLKDSGVTSAAGWVKLGA